MCRVVEGLFRIPYPMFKGSAGYVWGVCDLLHAHADTAPGTLRGVNVGLVEGSPFGAEEEVSAARSVGHTSEGLQASIKHVWTRKGAI